jgi:hypothetical protein
MEVIAFDVQPNTGCRPAERRRRDRQHARGAEHRRRVRRAAHDRDGGDDPAPDARPHSGVRALCRRTRAAGNIAAPPISCAPSAPTPNATAAASAPMRNISAPARSHGSSVKSARPPPTTNAEAARPLGQVLSRLTVQPERPDDDVVDRDVVLVWIEGNRRIITDPTCSDACCAGSRACRHRESMTRSKVPFQRERPDVELVDDG